MSLPSRILIFFNQQIVTLDVSLQRFRNQRDRIDREPPSVEHRSHPVEFAPGLTEHRRPPTGTSNYPPRTTESSGSAPVTLPPSAIKTPIGCKKRAGVFKVKRTVVPPNPVVQRRNEIRDVIEPLFSDAPFVLICEGKERDAVISTIRLTDALDPVDVWAKLSGVARQCTRRWKRLLGPVRLELVNLIIIGRHAQRPGAFRGQFQIVNIAERIEALQKLISNYNYDITEPSNPDERRHDSRGMGRRLQISQTQQLRRPNSCG
ncbi:uncharacterized protein BDZ83DRAFT_256865 [Colletotrichum acutatum]|uniref:Uncharacterized protein n=1 Tax=Glomerella acutata TaxID=27357 RepID=A0AAD8XG41_GLOAC|nr:uncharacterized protein BDZ83DRAFT_256865 [Colletotrichum acutatum]KAK1726659.1 hypothetical protein BDZ83DRAFT_256865 [Colletotrichum acutatum]